MSINSNILKGDSLFTSFRTINGRVPGLDFHLMRVLTQVNEFYLDNRFEISKLKDYFFKGLESDLTKFPNHYVRLTFYSERDSSNYGLSDINLFMSHKQMKANDEAKSLKVTPSPFSKYYIPAKSGSYFQALHLKRHARKQSFDDILLSYDGELSESSTSSIIFQKNDHFYISDHPTKLDSITVKLFESFLQIEKYGLETKMIKEKDLNTFDHIYSLNSVNLINGVKQVDSLSYQINTKIIENFKKYLQELIK